MRHVLGVASILGIAGVTASFGLFYLTERLFKFDQNTIQTLMYLNLSVAGHLTIFLTRTRVHFWQDRPSYILLGAVILTQTIATFVSVYGLFMHPIGWKIAGMVWVYALVWFVISDSVEIMALNIFDPEKPGLLTKKRRSKRSSAHPAGG